MCLNVPIVLHAPVGARKVFVQNPVPVYRDSDSVSFLQAVPSTLHLVSEKLLLFAPPPVSTTLLQGQGKSRD